MGTKRENVKHGMEYTYGKKGLEIYEGARPFKAVTGKKEDFELVANAETSVLYMIQLGSRVLDQLETFCCCFR